MMSAATVRPALLPAVLLKIRIHGDLSHLQMRVRRQFRR
jgi:hypothetical protein